MRQARAFREAHIARSNPTSPERDSLLEVIEDLPESLEVAVVAITNVIRCSACGHKTRRVHATRKVRTSDLPCRESPSPWSGTAADSAAHAAGSTTTENHPFFVDRMTRRLARAGTGSPMSTWPRSSTSGPAINTLCRWGVESLNFHQTGRATNGASEGVNTRIEVLERMAFGFASRANYPARVLLYCSGHPPALAS